MRNGTLIAESSLSPILIYLNYLVNQIMNNQNNNQR
ncbi:Uncharacterised protein [Budvicia aquatica]|uniref:Uncharacterized protein n=1 Tax=Budvicia aquatica TaxID=82979 RepID=A0A484ZQA1_9GAMM|nr:Uncharacterised protein [Budvicia aquatica]